jgi:hypothetical protein
MDSLIAGRGPLLKKGMHGWYLIETETEQLIVAKNYSDR